MHAAHGRHTEQSLTGGRLVAEILAMAPRPPYCIRTGGVDDIGPSLVSH